MYIFLPEICTFGQKHFYILLDFKMCNHGNAQGHSAVTPVILEPVFPRSRVKHSTTEQGLMCNAQGHSAVTPVRLEPVSPRYRG